MPADKPTPRHQRGVAAIEFALVAIVFFTIVFGTIEVLRMLYVYNTLQEVTRRAASSAAHVYPTDSTGIDRVRQAAIFRTSPGGLVLAAPVTDAHLQLSYLALIRDPISKALTMTPIATGALPDSAARNRQICMADPNAANCIRLVQVSICGTEGIGACPRVHSRLLMPIIDMRVPLHHATTIVPVESFGYRPGDSPCPC